jgi:hypothetical protein
MLKTFDVNSLLVCIVNVFVFSTWKYEIKLISDDHFPTFSIPLSIFSSRQFKVMFRVFKVQGALRLKFHFTNDQIGGDVAPCTWHED